MLRFVALWLLVRVGGRLPARVLYAAAATCGALAWCWSARLRAVTRDHMRHVLGDRTGRAGRKAVDRAARGCVRNAARYYADFARGRHQAPYASFAEVERFEHIDRFFEAYDRGCGVIMVSAHLGSPEYLFRSAGYLGLDMLVLTERLSPARVHDFVHRVRAVQGVRFLPADRSGLREMLAQLRAGGIVALLVDRDIQGSGHETVFFGERTTLPSGAVELALRTGAALLPVFAQRTGVARYRIVFDEELALCRTDDRAADLTKGMRALAAALERGIGAAPEQWFVLRPVWRGLVSGRRQRRRPAGPARTMAR